MKALAAVALALLLTSCAGWRPRDKALWATTVTCNAVDAEETARAVRSGAAMEGNPLYGRHPTVPLIVAIKAAILGAIWWSAESNPDNRTVVLASATGLCGGVLLWNAHEGVAP